MSDDRTEVILELAGDRALDGPVAGVVDAGRHFVGQQAPFVLEKLNGQHPYILQRFKHAACRIFRGVLNSAVELRRRRQRQAQDSRAMVIFHQWIGGSFAGAPAHRQNAELATERDEAFEQERCAVLRKFAASAVPRRRSIYHR